MIGHPRHTFQHVGSSGGYWKRFRAGPKNSPKRLRASRKMNYSGIVSRSAHRVAASKNDDDRSPAEFGALTSAPPQSRVKHLGPRCRGQKNYAFGKINVKRRVILTTKKHETQRERMKGNEDIVTCFLSIKIKAILKASAICNILHGHQRSHILQYTQKKIRLF